MIRGIIAGLILIVVLGGGYVLYAFYQKMQNADVQVERVRCQDPTEAGNKKYPKNGNHTR